MGALLFERDGHSPDGRRIRVIIVGDDGWFRDNDVRFTVARSTSDRSTEFLMSDGTWATPASDDDRSKIGVLVPAAVVDILNRDRAGLLAAHKAEIDRLTAELERWRHMADLGIRTAETYTQKPLFEAPPSETMSLRELRQQRGLTLEAVACLAGDDIDIATVSRIERGLVSPRPATVVKLAKALGMSVGRMQQHLAQTTISEDPNADT